MHSMRRALCLSAGGRLACMVQRSPATARVVLAATHSLSGPMLSCSSSSSLLMTTVAHQISTASFHSSPVHRAPSDVEDDLAKDLQDIIYRDRLVVFLTGTPAQPRCRFTAQLVDLLSQLGIRYSFFDITGDDEVCEGLKVYSDWPTYPQVYVDGELLGGYDICKKMMLDGALTRMLKEKDLM